MSEFHQEPTIGEAFEDAARAIERACGRPGWPTIGTFAAAIVVDPANPGEFAVSTGSSLDEGWAERAGGREAADRELRAMVRRYLDAADAEG
jgi:hypothetical protein